MNKLKTKAIVILSSMFLIILFLGLMGSNFIFRLSKDSRAIIQDNYASLDYTNNMQNALEKLFIIYVENKNLKSDTSLSEKHYQMLIDQFNRNLELEENNITEPGELELVTRLKNNYNGFLSLINLSKNDEKILYNPQIRDKYLAVDTDIAQIYKLNSKAILLKNNKAAFTARKVSVSMIVASMFSLLLALIFILYFPGYFIHPIEELTKKIKAVSSGDYNQKFLSQTKNELGQLAAAFNSMSARLKEYEENNLHKVLVEKKRISAVIESLTDAIFVLDENKNIVSVNKVALDLTGLKKEEIIDRPASEATAKNDLLKEIFRDLNFENRNPNKDNNTFIPIMVGEKKLYFSKEVIQARLDSLTSGPAGVIIILKNVTLYEERNTAKTNLLATASHELKTPLSSINLSIKLLEDNRIGELTDTHKKIIKTIRQETHRLSKIINDLLDYSQTESGNIRLKIVQVRPEDIIDYALTSLMMLISDKKIQVETYIEPGLPLVKADIEKTVWVLVNLITNAVRYTPENGTIKICCTGGGQMVSFSVIDQGSGIEKENLNKIFDKFIQIGKNPKGRGLGLAIAKEFVVSQSGNIRAESELGVGSTFIFQLPKA